MYLHLQTHIGRMIAADGSGKTPLQLALESAAALKAKALQGAFVAMFLMMGYMCTGQRLLAGKFLDQKSCKGTDYLAESPVESSQEPAQCRQVPMICASGHCSLLFTN